MRWQLTNLTSQSAALLGDPDFPKILNPAKHGERILRFQELYQQYSRLELSSDYDRPTAIDGLQRRLLRTMGVEGDFGILDDRRNKGLLRRSLLWRRGANTGRLKSIVFPEGREQVPSWSWMSRSGGIDYIKLEWDSFDWQDITSPWASPPASNVFAAKMRATDRWSEEEIRNGIVFDDPADDLAKSDYSLLKTIVLGIEKGSFQIGDRRHYVLAIIPKTPSDSSEDPLYVRIGAGYVLGKCLDPEVMNCFLV